ncbi:hypothetical protein PIB30_034647 [Stylosanthes scabra]|uniref:Uncharacterized protein n=1 Tax=Stylosanthes scabra TaxID=79078 RepID=A0ABU6Z9T9_9FABA|nr:hypothetical protein [Stylosanthes scabra]
MCQSDSKSQGSSPVNAQLYRIINHYILPQSGFYQRVTFLVSFDQENFQEVNSYLKGGGAAKKQATRGKQLVKPSAPPRPPSGRKSSTGKKIKKIVKSMKEMMREITNLVELMIQFSKDCHSQEVSNKRDLAKTKHLLRMTYQDILEEETHLSDEEDAKDVARDEQEEEDEED